MADVAVAESRSHGLGVIAKRDFAEGEVILSNCQELWIEENKRRAFLTSTRAG
jgi:hypothetical protein